MDDKLQLIALVALCLCAAFAQRARASGVFEFHLLDLERLDQQQPTLKGLQHRDRAQLMLHICLTEAFAVKSNGPCPYGNTTLLLNQRSSPAPANRSLAGAESYKSASGQQAEGRHQEEADARDGGASERGQGSQTTNLVRMPFAFKWTALDGSTSEPGRLEPAEKEEEEEKAKADEAAAGRRRGDKSSGGPLSLAASSGQPPPSHIIEEFAFAENHVLPNGGARSGKVYTQRQSRTQRMAITFNYRVSCAPQYYGDTCTTFCKPRDDQFGHYECSPTGHLVCLDGWLGRDCNVARCRPGCNQQHGFCDRPDTCSCRSGWTGARCDECLAYPGCQNGYCLAPWQCNCHKNWGGVLCDQDLNHCASHDPCLNNGTCENVAPARYKCRCPEGFTGANCELKLASSANAAELTSASLTRLSAGCLVNPCLNGGACNFELRQVAAEPPPTGPNLASTSSSEQEPQPLKVLAGPRYSCRCAAGWTGDFCQWPEAPSEAQLVSLIMAQANLTSGPTLDEQPAASTGAYFDDDPARHSTDALQQQQQAAVITLEPNQQLSPRPAANSHQQQHQQLEMRHLISGVVVASALGVFCASLLLAWCCLAAVEKGRFRFIQMNIVRQVSSTSSHDQDDGSGGAVSSTFQRMQAKIRDSFKKRTGRGGRIKPETKLSLENVLNVGLKMPPPSYEESGQFYHSSKSASANDLAESPYISTLAHKGPMPVEQFVPLAVPIHEEIVSKKTGALEKEIALKKSSASLQQQHQPYPFTTGQPTQIHCPKHGHLYRNQISRHQTALPSPTTQTTVVEIEYQQQVSTSLGRHKAHELRC